MAAFTVNQRGPRGLPGLWLAIVVGSFTVVYYLYRNSSTMVRWSRTTPAPAPTPTPTPEPVPTPTPEPVPTPTPEPTWPTKEDFKNAYALESTYPDWWPGSKAPNVINHHPLIVEMLNKANSLGVLELYQDKSAGFPLGPRLLLPPMRSEDNMKAAKQTLAQFKEMKAAVWADIYPADRQIVNLIINYLGGLIRKAEIINEARIQDAKARAAYEAAVAAAAPKVQTNYLITLQNPIEASILIGILNKTGKMHIRESGTNKAVLSTGPWGNNIKPKSSNNDGYVDGLDLLKLPINPRQVDKVNRKMLEAGIDEYGNGYKLTFTDKVNKKVLIELDLGSPTSVTDVPVDRANSEIDDIGRNIRYSATVVSY